MSDYTRLRLQNIFWRAYLASCFDLDDLLIDNFYNLATKIGMEELLINSFKDVKFLGIDSSSTSCYYLFDVTITGTSNFLARLDGNFYKQSWVIY